VELLVRSRRGSAERLPAFVDGTRQKQELPRCGDPGAGVKCNGDDARDAAGIARAHIEDGYTLREIATHLGVHYATISRRVCAQEERRKTEQVRDCKT